ncbi:isochorismatase family protein [Georgenia sunbinii]|uniref:isochorismatase family protein n=1 Tax=Georgenia sunbinii TaxID=3117728 RepID=UPI002F2639D3
MSDQTRALLVVDAQPTFCEGGALPSPGANAVCEAIADFVAAHRSEYALVVTTQDWHIDPGRHFARPPAEPDFIDTWPPHGIAGTAEAELHPALADLGADAAVRKGEYAAAYSGFEGTDAEGRTLAQVLDGVRAVDVVGLVESHCVKETALDAVRLGMAARVLTDLTVPVSPEQGAAAREELRAAGVEMVASTAR